MKFQRTRQNFTKKDRRHSGRYYPRPTTNDPEAQAYIQEEYDDWDNYRDGFRNWQGDGKKILRINNEKYLWSDKVKYMNAKNKRLLKRKNLMRKRNPYK